MRETFQAGVQYDDWKGSVAADELDKGGARELLRPLIMADEFLVGIKLWVGENHPGRPATPRLLGYVAKGAGFDNVSEYLTSSPRPVRLRRIELDVSADQFVMLFKRLEVVAAWKGLPLHGQEIEEVDQW